MAAWTRVILERFPRHLDADGRGKVLGFVVDALAADLDVGAAQLGRIRRSHRIGVADERRDVLALARLHDVADVDVGLLGRRLAGVSATRRTLVSPIGTSEDEASRLTDAESSLAELIGLPADSFPPMGGDADAANGRRERLIDALAGLDRHAVELDRLRALVLALVRNHRSGNGSVRSILSAVAAHLHLGVVAEVADSPDRYWHALRCRDLLRVSRPEPPGHRPAITQVLPIEDVVALEENPVRPADVLPAPRRHAEHFSVFRRGFEEAAVAVVVRGIEDRTVRPMVVNVDTGEAVAFVGAVPQGGELRFERDGRVLLDGADAAAMSYGFSGGVFADADGPHRNDFVWAADGEAPRVATFAVTRPIANAFDTDTSFPHSVGRLENLRMSTGESRWVLFVAEGAFAGQDAAGEPILVAPNFAQATFDSTVYADANGTSSPGAEVGFAWLEREPFAARVWIPMRFASLDADEAEVPVRERLRVLLDRHRPAGVHLYVEYSDDRWTLGDGVLRDAGSTEATGFVVAGTRLWAQPEAPPD